VEEGGWFGRARRETLYGIWDPADVCAGGVRGAVARQMCLGGERKTTGFRGRGCEGGWARRWRGAPTL